MTVKLSKKWHLACTLSALDQLIDRELETKAPSRLALERYRSDFRSAADELARLEIKAWRKRCGWKDSVAKRETAP